MTPSLVTIMLLVASRSVSVGVASASQLPRQGLPQTGRVAVTGHFEDRDGHQISRLVDLFPAPVRDFVSLTRELWATQIRVFEKDGQMLLNELQIDHDGQFTIDLPQPGVYRFELNPTESLPLRRSRGHRERRDDAYRFGGRGKTVLPLRHHS
jgi:hypothetical protein